MAGKRQVPEPTIPKGRNTYTFYYYDCNDDRRPFSTGLDSKSEAKKLAEQMYELYDLSYNDDAAREIDDSVYEAYFGHSKEIRSSGLENIKLTIEDAKIIDKYIGANEPDFIKRFILAIEHYSNGANEVVKLRADLADYEDLKESIAARQVIASKNCPTYEECFEVFIEKYKNKRSVKQINDVIRINDRFRKFVDNQKPSTISISQIRDFIDSEVESSLRDKNGKINKNANPDSRRRKTASLLSIFFYQTAERYDFICPFQNMASVRNDNIKKRKITWYDLPEIEDIISGLNPYWSAVVATMAYAGLGLKELSGLRHDDFIKVIQVNEEGQKEILYFLNVEPHTERTLKNRNRDDLVPVDPNYLLPHLQKFFSLKLQGKKYIFEKPKDMRRNKNSNSMWNDSHLSQKMNGAKVREDKEGRIRGGCKGILPPGYKARNLRHTFGSLLIRSGYNVDDACRLTRNTRDVFTEHYARILGIEMRVNIKEGSKKAKILKMESVFTA